MREGMVHGCVGGLNESVRAILTAIQSFTSFSTHDFLTKPPEWPCSADKQCHLPSRMAVNCASGTDVTPTTRPSNLRPDRALRAVEASDAFENLM